MTAGGRVRVLPRAVSLPPSVLSGDSMLTCMLAGLINSRRSLPSLYLPGFSYLQSVPIYTVLALDVKDLFLVPSTRGKTNAFLKSRNALPIAFLKS